jgi:hypothetical protein
LAKYDRTPEEENVGIKITPKGRTVWSQVMLKHLADARKSAIEEVIFCFVVIANDFGTYCRTGLVYLSSLPLHFN